MPSLRQRLLTDRSTGKSLDCPGWCFQNKLPEMFGFDSSALDAKVVGEKKNHGLYDSYRTDIAFPPEFDDLTRLHFIARNRRATTILEFGCGKSTPVFANALAQNKRDYGDFVDSNLRRANPFELHSVDQSKEWMIKCQKDLPEKLAPLVNFHFSPVTMTTFQGRACTVYNPIPNVCPDIIYLDGPSQFDVTGEPAFLSDLKWRRTSLWSLVSRCRRRVVLFWFPRLARIELRSFAILFLRRRSFSA